MRVAVIGGAGYIGSHVVLALQDVGHEPVIFDDLSTGLREHVTATGARFVRGDVRNKRDLARFFGDTAFDAVIHLAAKKAVGESMQHPGLYAENNIVGTVLLLNEMRTHNVTRFVFSSSASVYGTPKSLPVSEDDPIRPESMYGFTKAEVERVLTWYDHLAGLRFASLRYFNAVGYDPDGRITGRERDPQNLFPLLFETALGLRPEMTIYGEDYDTPDGTCVRDYIHVTDLADAHVKALDRLDQGSFTVNLGTGHGYSVRACVAAVQDVMGTFPVRIGERRPGDPASVYADPSRAKQLLNWEPTHSDLPTIVRTMAQVYQQREKGGQ